jgi:hypothetical protein
VTVHRGVRYRADVGWELRCDGCAYRRNQVCYWPLTHEFWDPDRGMGRCRACWNERTKTNRAKRMPSVPELAVINDRRRAAHRKRQAERDRERAA